MLDQSFTAYHFNEIFQIERRKGNIRKEYFPEPYLSVLKDGHDINDQIRTLKNKKRTEWTDEERREYQNLKDKLKENLKERRIEEDKWLESIADKVNRKGYHIVLSKTTLPDGKSGYTVPDDSVSLFVMKTLMSNLKKVFKVQQANRHRIMTQVRHLMNESTPKYIIRTDVHHFYESIPQEKLLGMIKDNALLSKMTIRFIWQVLDEYEKKKDAEEKKGLGVPRGVGVSAFLSEIYLRDLDEKIKRRPEVVYYVRYVDDIFMILSHLPEDIKLEQYYDGIRKEFAGLGLELMDPSIEEQRNKLQLLDLHTFMNEGEPNQKFRFTYLGYQLISVRSWCKSGTKLTTQFEMSDAKRYRLKTRIDAAFEHFTEKTKYSLSEARKDLRDSLRFITGNYKLTKSKSGIKAGIYYTSDLLTEKKILIGLTVYLHAKARRLIVYPEVLKDTLERKKYIDSIAAMVMKYSFLDNWEQHKCYTLPDKRIREISRWLLEK